ncbi:GNAT family N-acetyltransferase [Paraburkholderia rhizosphaerae]|uniref:Ribosomal protein S18 acetylase RimI-like enzyme n=1 Tax=Paraburkholderia rhizosphaerae TaxID=480658 RepID=A0A4R8LPD2_9BURK|nr:GNAT family N-acetyltransferase [Paraburkholderia rhizosphaerae]TDY46414.1 ribosomal protein S18 acetylase RimI-like enzyme [Paraburkholderia rhizosphaerae]
MHSTSSLSLRTASATDADLVASIHAASWQASYRGLLPEDFLDSEVVRERATYWHARMNAPGADRRLVLIAERRAEPIAFACVERQPGSPWGALLDNLHALPAHQRNGAGSLLLYAVQNWAREQGETQLCLYVLEANAAAIAFYERRGWRLSGAEPDRVGGVDITMLRYLYRLDDAAPHR